MYIYIYIYIYINPSQTHTDTHTHTHTPNCDELPRLVGHHCARYAPDGDPQPSALKPQLSIRNLKSSTQTLNP